MILQIILGLGNKLANLFIFALILSRLKSFRKLILKRPVNLQDKLILSLVFGVWGIVGTYFSIEFEGALVNTRIIGVATGGLLGGPLVGLIGGLIAGIHRYLIPAGGFTTTACAISTVFEGLMAGYMTNYIKNKENKWIYAALTGAIAESMRKISVLIFSRPFEDAVMLVKAIWIPMVVINSLGMALLFIIIDNIFSEEEKVVAEQAQLTLKIVDKTLPFIKKGINSESIQRVAQIVYDMTDYDAVSFTNREYLVAHAGAGTPRHGRGKPIVTDITKKVLNTGEPVILGSCTELNCEHVNNCPLSSVIMYPLKEEGKVIGTFKIYKSMENSMTSIDVELASGLARLFSTQLLLGKLEERSKLLARAELKALQAQINPHFLFNSLTVIGSLCRTDSEKARDLIIHLSNVFRKNLNMNKEKITLEEELNHVKSYVAIEKCRFEDKLQVIYEIEENLECLIPPLTLQPIVENSIKHGLLPKKNGGKVSVKANSIKDEVIVYVEDDGVGIDEKTLLNIMNDENNKDSIGVNNVNKRLKGLFGDEYGLYIDSQVEKGTCVMFKIPMKPLGEGAINA